MIKATSKKTGIAIKKPVIIRAQEAFFSPKMTSKKIFRGVLERKTDFGTIFAQIPINRTSNSEKMC